MLRLGIILTVTGIIVLVHYISEKPAPLPRRAELIIVIVLMALGAPLLVMSLL